MLKIFSFSFCYTQSREASKWRIRPIPYRCIIALVAELSDRTFISHFSSAIFSHRCLMSNPSKDPATAAINSDSPHKKDIAFCALTLEFHEIICQRQQTRRPAPLFPRGVLGPLSADREQRGACHGLTSSDTPPKGQTFVKVFFKLVQFGQIALRGDSSSIPTERSSQQHKRLRSHFCTQHSS